MAITFATSPDSTAVQFLEPVQTAGGRHPYLFTQCQAIHARSFVPCQVCRLCSPVYVFTGVCSRWCVHFSSLPAGSCVPSLADRPREDCTCLTLSRLQSYPALQTAGGSRSRGHPAGSPRECRSSWLWCSSIRPEGSVSRCQCRHDVCACLAAAGDANSAATPSACRTPRQPR